MACRPKKTTRTNPGCIVLPVAPRANARRRFGEPDNPGRALGPGDVLQWLDRVLADGVPLAGAVVGGPGEPLAEPAPLLETLRGAREKHPELALSLVTNGLGDPTVEMGTLAKDLAAAGLSKVTVLMDAVDPALVAQIYAWIRPGRRTVPLPEASALLVDSQAQAIRAFREAGLFVTVRMTIFAGVNDHHVEDVANAAAALGADMLDLVEHKPAPVAAIPAAKPESGCAPSACATCGSAKGCGSKAPAPADEAQAVETLSCLASGRLDELRAAAARYIALTPDADCCGDIHWMENAGGEGALGEGTLPKPKGERRNVAVASSDGMDVDLHLGQAIQFLIFGPREGDGLPSLLGTREAPEPGGGDERWVELSERLSDCFTILAASAGARAREVLSARGLSVLSAETDIKGAVDLLFGGGKKSGKKRVKAD